MVQRFVLGGLGAYEFVDGSGMQNVARGIQDEATAARFKRLHEYPMISPSFASFFGEMWHTERESQMIRDAVCAVSVPGARPSSKRASQMIRDAVCAQSDVKGKKAIAEVLTRVRWKS